MAASMTVKMTNPEARDGDNKITIDWIAHTDGSLAIAIASQYSTTELAKGYPGCAQPSKLVGRIQRVLTAPGLNGDLATSLPTAAYDITLIGPHGSDLAAGNLKDRSGTLAESWTPNPPTILNGDITLTIANAGNGTKGRIIIYMTEER